jgi:ParB-like chromosome segregation protein Spo0J
LNTLNVEYRKVEALIPYARNPRTHAEGQIAKIAASIVEYGWTNPILVDGDNGIIAGTVVWPLPASWGWIRCR